jgi:alkylation response protein AidB-like acyl-CoA dehydrogenase
MTSFVNTFGLSDQQLMVRDNVLELLGRKLPWPRIRELDEASEFPHAAYDALAEAGYLGLYYPEALGGAGGSARDFTSFIETLGYYYTGIAQAVMTTIVYAGMHVVKFGSPEVQKNLLPKIINGRCKLALAMSEPGTGSDVAGIRTSAVRDGDDYVIQGQKIWITCAHVADYIVVVCKTDPAASRHRGLSIMLVDARAPGVTIRKLQMLGRRTTHANEVFFDNVRTPASYLLGEENAAWPNLMKCLAVERLSLAAISAGHCFRITEYATDYASNRVQFGHPITDYQAVSHKLVDMAIMSEVARQSVYRVADLLDGGQDVVKEVSMAKIICTENNFKCADLGLQVMGGAGYSTEYDMAMFFRDSRVGPIGGGSNEIQRNVIAKQMGL